MPLVEMVPGDIWVHFAKPGLESELFLGWAYADGVFQNGLYLETPRPEDLKDRVLGLKRVLERADFKAIVTSLVAPLTRGTSQDETIGPFLFLASPLTGGITQVLKKIATVVTQTVVKDGHFWIESIKNRNDARFDPFEIVWDRELPKLRSDVNPKSAFERLLNEDLLSDSNDQPASSTSEEL